MMAPRRPRESVECAGDLCEMCGETQGLRDAVFFDYDPVLKAQKRRAVKLCGECASTMDIEPTGGAAE